MKDRNGTRAALLIAALGALLLANSAQAAPVGKPSSGLVLAPEDAAFFSTSLRNREQLGRFLKSNAFATLRDLPAVQTAWNLFLAEYNNEAGELADLRAFLEQEENQELIALLLDAGSEEVFGYGGKGWTDLMQIFLAVNQAQYTSVFQAAPGGAPPDALMARAIFGVLLKHQDKLAVPELVYGFKLKDTKRAQNQIARLEGILKAVLADAPPPIQAGLKREKVGDDSFLTFQLDGSVVPWDEIPFREIEAVPGEYDPLKKKLRALTLSVAIGVRGDYLLLSIGKSNEHIASLGKGKVLADRSEFAPLSKAEGKPLTSIMYVSGDFMGMLSEYNVQQMTSYAGMARAVLAASELPEAKQKAIAKDLDTFVAEVKANIPKAGASVSFSFLTERGYEGYTYDHGEHPNVDDSAPLALLDHVGGNPILAVVGRSKGDPEAYEFLAKWAQTGYGHADELLRATLPPEEKEHYEKAVKVFLPLVKRFDEVTRTLFIPAFDGQFGFVVDAKWKSKQWQKDMPEMPVAIPLPELGLVFGLSDADKLTQAGEEYRKLVNAALAEVAKVAPPGEMPFTELPAPQTEKTDVGTLYSYPLPKEAGLDPQVAPNAGVSGKVAVMTLSKGHSTRLLTPTPLKVEGGPLGDRTRKATAAMIFNFPALIDAVEPWALFAAQMAEAEIGRELGDEVPPGFKNIPAQAEKVLRVLRCMKGVRSITYTEGKALMTHSETVFQDLKK